MKLSQLREQKIDYANVFDRYEDLLYAERKHWTSGQLAADFGDDDLSFVPELQRAIELKIQADELFEKGVGQFHTLVDELGGLEALRKLARRHNVAQKRQRG